MSTFRIDGIPEFRAAIERVKKSLGNDKLEPIIKGAADIITKQVRVNVNAINKVSGRLRASPKTKMLKGMFGNRNPRPSISAIERSPYKKSGAPHAHLVERGAKGGTIPAQPFFRPAWDMKRGEALKHIETESAKSVKGAVR